MRWSTQIGKVLGIPIRVHWSMALLLLLFSWGSGLGGIAATGLSLVLLFASVLMHELAHALAARAGGIGTSEILLLPIGGLAKIEQEPRSGKQEVAIALAGPAMSLVLGGLAGLLMVFGPPTGIIHAVATMVTWANVMLGLFNLLPAFPLDGGRVLRGALRERRGLLEATRIAATVGRVLAVPMALAGLVLGSVSLVLVAGFVWLSGRAEQRMIEARAAWQGDDGWRMPAADPWSRLAGLGPFAAARGNRAAPSPLRPRRFVIEAGPFGYVIREV